MLWSIVCFALTVVYTVDWVLLKTADLWLWTMSDMSPWAHLLVVGTLIQQSLPTPFPSVLCDDFSLTGPFICICFLKTLPIEPRFPLHPLFWPVPRYALSALIGSYNRERERGGREREREGGGRLVWLCPLASHRKIQNSSDAHPCHLHRKRTLLIGDV